MRIIDVITYNGEKELFDIRYNILKDVVDEFIVCEAPTTFSGREKPLYFKEIQDKYNKVKYHVIDENYTREEIELAENSPNTVGASHWKREFLQKESIKKALTNLWHDDVVFIGDCDEIWDSQAMSKQIPFKVLKLRLKVFTYYLNNRSSEEFAGTIVAKYQDIKDECLNHLRSNAPKTKDYCGWHFTSMGGYEKVRDKLEDSYTRESYWTEGVEDNLEDNIKNSRDFLGRSFTYSINEFDLPKYLLDNKDKYKHLFKVA